MIDSGSLTRAREPAPPQLIGKAHPRSIARSSSRDAKLVPPQSSRRGSRAVMYRATASVRDRTCSFS